MKNVQTKKCIVCLKKATNWSGFVMSGTLWIDAGFCEEHKKIVIPDLLNEKGCCGGYHEKYEYEEY